MERESACEAGSGVERNNEVGVRPVSLFFLQCACCCVPLGELACDVKWRAGPEGDTLEGFEQGFDGSGLIAWFVCNECLGLAIRSADTLRGSDGCVEPGGDGLPGDGDIRSSVTQVDQPANVVEASSDSDGCGRSGGQGFTFMGEHHSESWYPETPTTAR
jgi:hypothetical protein